MDTQLEPFLRPRFEVIGRYPDSIFKINEIIQFELDTFGNPVLERIVDFTPSYFQEYPNLFKELQWYENRSDEDMPTHVRCLDTYCYNTNGGSCYQFRDKDAVYEFQEGMDLSKFIPATINEYNQYRDTLYNKITS